ncbi:hypothetical protein EDC94DRAFT_610123 [Helicostylum pulchrum]|nr:hypothetical protein EDC94DRAFT_610123 [Helicostylum pulchrum]
MLDKWLNYSGCLGLSSIKVIFFFRRITSLSLRLRSVPSLYFFQSLIFLIIIRCTCHLSLKSISSIMTFTNIIILNKIPFYLIL